MKKLIIPLILLICLGGYYFWPKTDPYKDIVVETDGRALPAYEGQAGQNDLAWTLIAPSLKGKDYDSNTVKLAQNGKPQLVIFLAHWCPHCRREVPLLVQDWKDQGLYEDLEVTTVLTSIKPDRDGYPPDEWLESEGWPYKRVILDDKKSSALQAYGGASFPLFVMLDKNFRVMWRADGEPPAAEIRERIKELVPQPEQQESSEEPEYSGENA